MDLTMAVPSESTTSVGTNPGSRAGMNTEPAKPMHPDGIDATIALEEVALVALRDPNLTPEERVVLEKAVGSARSRQKRLPRPEVGP